MIWGPALFGVALILLPFIAGKGQRSPFRRPWSFIIVAFVLFMIAYYGAVGRVAPWSPRMDAPPLPVQVVVVSLVGQHPGCFAFSEKRLPRHWRSGQ